MKSCLIIDDSLIVRRVARLIIEGVGFACTEADDGVAAIAHCEKTMPDVVIVDWNMPTMSGMEFMQKLRALPGGDKTKIIFCTAENEVSFIQQALSAGADEYIIKPFDAEILRIKLAQVGLI